MNILDSDGYIESVSQAIEKSAKFYNKKKPSKKPWLYWHVLQQVSLSGLWLEFGTGSGETAVYLSRIMKEQNQDGILYTFDSFEGLPEPWDRGNNDTYEIGRFAQKNWHKYLDVFLEENPNVEVIVGMFQDTLERFLQEHDGVCAFIHIDCDLYSSTKHVLNCLADRIVPGTIILFDEFYNYPNYLEHEFKAWKEYTVEHVGRINGSIYFGSVPDGHQVALKVI
jgi:predicted O-methyltransferase YrrM